MDCVLSKIKFISAKLGRAFRGTLKVRVKQTNKKFPQSVQRILQVINNDRNKGGNYEVFSARGGMASLAERQEAESFT